MKRNFKNSADEIQDKRGKKLSIDDLCEIDFPGSRLHKFRGTITALHPNHKADPSVELKLEQGGTTTVLASLLIRKKEAHETSEYRLPKPPREHRNRGGRGGWGRDSYYGRPANLDSLGNDQSNPAIGDAFAEALKKYRPRP